MKRIKYCLLLLLTWTTWSTLQAQTFPRDSFEISGRVLATSGQPMPNVEVTLIGTLQIWVDTTRADGRYAFQGIPGKEDYNLQFAKEGARANGLSANDFLLIQRHILYLTRLGPFSLFVADLNGGGGISTLDVVLLARILFGFGDPLSVPNWRFSYAYTDFDVENPTSINGPIPPIFDHYPIHGLNGDLRNIDFIGLKTGDVDQTADPFE